MENPLWGAPRIHGELLMLGFDVAQSSTVVPVHAASHPVHHSPHVARKRPPVATHLVVGLRLVAAGSLILLCWTVLVGLSGDCLRCSILSFFSFLLRECGVEARRGE